MKRIRGGSGLGDAIYVRVVAEHFIRRGEAVQALSNWRDVFIGSGAEVAPFSKENVDVVAHYSPYKRDPRTKQWADVLRCARIDENVPLKFGWTVRNRALVTGLQGRAKGRPIVLVHGGREPMGRRDGFGMELLPAQAAFETALAALADCFLVRIGRGTQIYPLTAAVDLNGGTTVSDLLDVAWSCAGIVAQCSFCVPLAEAFGKPLLAVWAARGLASKQKYLSTITPEKVLSSPKARHVVDDWPAERIAAVAAEFRAAAHEAAASFAARMTSVGVAA